MGFRNTEYLVVVGLGCGVEVGVWRRFTDFARLAQAVGAAEGGAGPPTDAVRGQFRMTAFSWAVLQRRKRMFRCLERDYLVLKCFLLERFLHDLVFESYSPATVRDFLGIW